MGSGGRAISFNGASASACRPSAHIGAQLGRLPSGGAGSTRAGLVCGGGSASVMSTGGCPVLLDRGVVISSWLARCTFCGGVSPGLCGPANHWGIHHGFCGLSQSCCSFCQLRCILQLGLEPDLPKSTRRGSDSNVRAPQPTSPAGRPGPCNPRHSLKASRVTVLTLLRLAVTVKRPKNTLPYARLALASVLSPCVFTWMRVTSLHSMTGAGLGFDASPSQKAR